jgi:cellulase/cellobiase CelA1
MSRLTGGKHFVINTAENGRGPIHHYLPNGRRITLWCNPPNRGLGTPPTSDTSNPMVDAYLWINRPGYGQSCAGQQIAWDTPRAPSYARHATDWESPPKALRTGSAGRSAEAGDHCDDLGAARVGSPAHAHSLAAAEYADPVGQPAAALPLPAA